MPKHISTKKKRPNPLAIQQFLGGVDYPVHRADLVSKAAENEAPREVIAVLKKIRDKEYTTPAEVTKEAAHTA